jgi:hypothetical protein
MTPVLLIAAASTWGQPLPRGGDPAATPANMQATCVAGWTVCQLVSPHPALRGLLQQPLLWLTQPSDLVMRLGLAAYLPSCPRIAPAGNTVL